MGNNLKELHAAVLAEVREKIANLRVELDTLVAVERYHAAQLGGSANGLTHTTVLAKQVEAGVQARDVKDKSWHDAAAIALRSIGKPASAVDVLEVLLAAGRGADMDRKIARAGVFTAMNRRRDMFHKNDDGTWSLVEWEGGK